MKLMRTYLKQNIAIVLCANKVDKRYRRQVSTQEGKAFAEKHGMTYVETCANRGVGVRKTLETLTKHMTLLKH